MGSPLATSVKIHAESKNEIPTAGTAIQCARSRIQWPNNPMIRNAANGRSGMSAYFIPASPFHQVELFGGDGGLAAVERDDDRQPTATSAAATVSAKKTKTWPATLSR